jgi:hypothetical protein
LRILLESLASRGIALCGSAAIADSNSLGTSEVKCSGVRASEPPFQLIVVDSMTLSLADGCDGSCTKCLLIIDNWLRGRSLAR